MATNNDSLPSFDGDGKDVFIEYGPGGRSPDNGSDPFGVREGQNWVGKEFDSESEARRQAENAPSRV